MTKAEVFKLGESGLDVSPLEQQREFSYQIRIYDRSGDKVGEFASGIKNTKSVNFNFGYLRDGGCSDFSFTLGDVSPFTIDYHYQVEFCFYNQTNPWYSGYVTKLPERGTAKQQTYSGYGYRKQLDGIRINEVDTAEEVADIIEDTLDYLEVDGTLSLTDIKKNSDKIPAAIYAMVSTIYWDRIPASDLFERLRQLAGAPGYEWGVDEERDFYFRKISTQIFENFWIGKHLDSFKGTEDPDSIKNRLYVKCGRLTDGSDYVLTVPDPSAGLSASQTAYGLKEDVVVAPEFWPTFHATNLSIGGTASTNIGGDAPGKAINGNPAIYWDSQNAQTIGHYIQVDFGVGVIHDHIARVILDSTTALARDQFARGFDIRISHNGNFTGEEIVVFTSTISGDLSTNNPDIRFTPTRGRYVRITLTTAYPAENWHLGEFEVYRMDTSDVERWANYILGQKDNTRKKASLTIKKVNKLIETKHVIKPFKPRGQWGIYDEDGNHIEDYPVISIKYSLSGNSFDMMAELGELERESIPAEFKRQLQRLEEYNMSGVRSSDDLASGVGTSSLSVLRTMIGKEQIETPHLVAGAVTTDVLRALSVIASKVNITDLADIANLLTVAGGRILIGADVLGAGLHGILITDDAAQRRVEIGEIANNIYGLTIRDASNNVTVDLGKVMGAAQYKYLAANNAINTNSIPYVDMPNLTTGLVAFPKCIVLCLTVIWLDTATTPSTECSNIINIDAGDVGYESGAEGGKKLMSSNMHVQALAAGNHTIKVRWKSDPGANVSFSTARRLAVLYWEVQ